jgi:hypothetical protein
MYIQNLGVRLFSSTVGVLMVVGLMPALPAQAQLAVTRDIVFPVIGPVTYGNDFSDPRDGGTRYHKGNDILGKKMQPLVAAVDGIIDVAPYPEASWGYGVSIKDKDGYEYWYIHMNNDTPGTDDGKGDGRNAYALDVQPGNSVVKGQLIGYMGDSGNAEGTPPHLHFEIEAPGAGVMNPYPSLKAAQRLSAPVSTYPELPREILPYQTFTGGMSVAAGNFDADSDTEVVTGAGPGGGPLVRVFEKDKTPLTAFYAYDATFRGGVDVATGDVDGDGKSEIITAAGAGGGPHIRIFDIAGKVLKEFFAYDTKFHGGVQVATGDLDGDGKAEIITGAGPGGGPHVRVFNASGTVVKEFLAYTAMFRGGVDVALMPKTDQGSATIITAPLSAGGPHVKYFDGTTGALTKEFFAYDATFTGGIHLAVGKIDTSQAEYVLTVPASGGGPHLKVFGWDGAFVKDAFPGFEPWARGGYGVAAYDGSVFISSGPGRRASLRQYSFSQSNNSKPKTPDSFSDNSSTPLPK